MLFASAGQGYTDRLKLGRTSGGLCTTAVACDTRLWTCTIQFVAFAGSGFCIDRARIAYLGICELILYYLWFLSIACKQLVCASCASVTSVGSFRVPHMKIHRAGFLNTPPPYPNTPLYPGGIQDFRSFVRPSIRRSDHPTDRPSDRPSVRPPMDLLTVC